ncbi:MAG: DNA polymerase I [Bacilli bacterium]|nr:DNA polymerase I [Bacilli bacterium]
MKKLIIIDGYSLLFRAYYATAYGGTDTIMRTKSGIPTNAIFAFANMINKILGQFKGEESIFVGFDAGGPCFRREKYDKYKANRSPCPEELKQQMPIVREFLDALNLKRYEEKGFEGDDICGTVAKTASKEGYEVSIITSDRDFLQLIDDHISIDVIKKGLSDIQHVNKDNIISLYGFTANQLIDFKGLRGDSSDNLPGIPGVGEKTAQKLLSEYKDLETIIAKADEIGGKVGNNIKTYQEQGRDCKFLATIKTDIKLPFKVSDCKYEGYTFDEINKFCQKYELKAVLNRLPTKLKKGATAIKISYQKVDDIPDDIKEMGIYLDLDNDNYHNAKINAIGVSTIQETYVIDEDKIKGAKNLINLLKDENVKKYVYDFKEIKVALHKIGIEINGLTSDLLLAGYLLDSSLKNDVVSIMNYFNIDVGVKTGSLDLLASGTDYDFIAKCAYYVIYLKEKINSELTKVDALNLYQKIELPLALVLSDMEIEGFPLDKHELETIGETFKEKLDAITKDIYQTVGFEFNIASPKQVADTLFNKLKLEGNKNNSTSVEVLEAMKEDHPVIKKILEHRKYAKLISTYVDALADHIHEDGKIHAMFNQALTTTGRLSSSEPNLQNISVRDEEGRLIRKAFHYPNNEYQILSLDYSQIELRVLAALAKSQALIDVFAADRDIHTETAKKTLKLDREPNANERRKAKAVNFGIVYGISEFGLAEDLGITRLEAREIINNFYEAYPEVGEFLRDVVSSAEKNNYVKTYFNRRRYLREFHDQSYQVREFAKRAAMNAPIQGTAADIIKIAMINVSKMLKDKHYKSQLVLQIHDELIFKVYKDEKDNLIKDITKVMESIDFPIKLKVSIGIGDTWYEAK